MCLLFVLLQQKIAMGDIINCGETAMIRPNGVVYVPINPDELFLQTHADTVSEQIY